MIENSETPQTPAGDAPLTVREAWQRTKEIEGISDVYHVLLILFAAIGNNLRRFPPLVMAGTFIRKVLYYSISYSSPELKFDLTPTLRRYHTRFIFLLSLFIGLIVSFGYPAIFSLLAGTLRRINDPSLSRIYYLEDTKNLLIYIFLSPLYLACSITIILTAFQGWLLYPARAEAKPVADARRSTALVRFMNISLILFYLSFMPIWINVNQFNSIMNQSITKNVYWFVNETPEMIRYVNAAGIAYFVINSLKMIIITSAVLCFLASAIEVLNIGQRVREIRSADFPAIEGWRERLRHYALIELLAKALTIVLAIHLSVFAQQEWSEKTSNVTFQALAIVLIGMILIPFPRAYLEFKWMMEERKSQQSVRWPDIRPADLRVFFVIISWVLYGAAVSLGSLLGYQTNIFAILACRIGIVSCPAAQTSTLLTPDSIL